MAVCIAVCIVCKNILKEGETRCRKCGFKAEPPLFFSEKQARAWQEEAVESWKTRWIRTGATGIGFVVMPNEDGTVLYAGESGELKREVEAWRNVEMVAAGNFHVLGLLKDGSVVAAGKNHLGQCETASWSRIVKIAACADYSVGLDGDGRVHICGDIDDYGLREAENWRNIIGIGAGLRHLLGLCRDGTVEAVGDNQDHQCDVESWRDIVQVEADTYHSRGLTKEGKWISTEE